MLVRKVLRRASRAGEGVGWKTGRGPEGKMLAVWMVACLCRMGRGWFGGAVPCFRRVGVVAKERVWEMRRWRQGRQ